MSTRVLCCSLVIVENNITYFGADIFFLPQKYLGINQILLLYLIQFKIKLGHRWKLVHARTGEVSLVFATGAGAANRLYT